MAPSPTRPAGTASSARARGRPACDVCRPANPLRWRRQRRGVPHRLRRQPRSPGRPRRPLLRRGRDHAERSRQRKNAVGLVFVAAFAPEANETLTEINGRYPDVPLGAALLPFTYAKDGGGQGTDLWIDPAKFHDAFCRGRRCRSGAPDVGDAAVGRGRTAFTTAVSYGTPASKNDFPLVGDRGLVGSGDPSRRRTRDGEAGGERERRDRRIACGSGVAAEACRRGHRPRRSGNELTSGWLGFVQGRPRSRQSSTSRHRASRLVSASR